METEEVAVLAGDAVALRHLGRLAGDLRYALELSGSRSDPYDGRDGIPERLRVELGVVPGDDSCPLQPLHSLGDRRRRKADSAAELGHPEARVLAELGQDSEIHRIK